MASLIRLCCTFTVGIALVSGALAQSKLPRRPWLGAQLGPAQEGGLRIGNVLPGGSAEGAGLKTGDVLKSLDGTAIASVPQLVQVMNAKLPGDQLKAKLVRDGNEMELAIPLVSRPVDKGDTYSVDYDEAVSNGARVRVLISKPTGFTGKRPVLYMIQGIGYSSMEFPLSGQNGLAQILKAYNDKGYVTVRVEKPGVGDSEGGPANSVDFEEEVDAFRQALKLVKSKDYVDPENIFLLGLSMGGCHAPILASESPVKGVAVFGTVARTWQEYIIENSRRQWLMSGMKPADVDREIRSLMAVSHVIFNEGLEPDEAKKKYPAMEAAINDFSPDGKTMSGMPLPYWRQIFARNLAEHWTETEAQVFAVWGEADFLSAPKDHEFIAEIVNGVRPGTAKWQVLEDSDHLFNHYDTQAESMKNWPQGPFNPSIIPTLLDWSESVRSRD